MSTPIFAVKFYKGEPLKNNFYPIVLQVSYQKNDKHQSSRIRLGIKARQKQWDFEEDEFINNPDLNRQIEEKLVRATRVYNKFFVGRNFDFSEFAKRYRDSFKKDFFEVLDAFIDHKKGEGASVNTIIYYDTTIRKSIINFVGKQLPIKSITVEWLEEYGRKYKSAAYFRGLRAVMKYARKKGYIEMKDYPFENDFNPDGYSFKHLRNRKDKEPEIALTEQEIELFKTYDCAGRERKAWDTFMLSYYLFGTNLWDFMHFTDANRRGEGIVYKRSKTGVIVRMSLMPQAQEIIDRYRDERNWFPIIDVSLSESERKRKQNNYRRSINRTLKRIAKKLGIDERIKLYTARHSAATIAIKKGAPIQEVSALLGHKTILTTQQYLAKFDTKELSGTMNLL